MPYSVVRFNCIQPGLDPAEMSARYQAFVDMAGYADEHSLQAISLEEHHGADNGWSPSPLVMAGLVFGRTKTIMATLNALLAPLHDPLRLAEDIAVLDLASGGRFVVTAGIGYRESEYEAHGKDWAGRGALQDEAIDTMLKAWTGEPFEYRGTTVRVTPRPFTQPHPTLMLGGSSKVAVRRAARFGLPYLPPANLPELEAYYYEQCAEFGTQGFCAMPPEHTAMTFVAEDPERGVARPGPPLLRGVVHVRGVAAARTDVVGALPRVERRGAAGRGHLRGGHARGARRPAQGRGAVRHLRAAPARRWHADRRRLVVVAPVRRRGPARAGLILTRVRRATSSRRPPTASGRVGASCGTRRTGRAARRGAARAARPAAQSVGRRC